MITVCIQILISNPCVHSRFTANGPSVPLPVMALISTIINCCYRESSFWYVSFKHFLPGFSYVGKLRHAATALLVAVVGSLRLLILYRSGYILMTVFRTIWVRKIKPYLSPTLIHRRRPKWLSDEIIRHQILILIFIIWSYLNTPAAVSCISERRLLAIPKSLSTSLSTLFNVFERFDTTLVPCLFLLTLQTTLSAGNYHPVKFDKMFTKHFKGVTNISSVELLRVKLCFDSLINANACLAPLGWLKMVYTPSVSSPLIYSLVIIHLDTCTQ